MNNVGVQAQLNDCREELTSIKALLTGIGDQALPAPYIKKYAIIRATGSIESAFKQIIADKVDQGSHLQLKNFIARKIRNSSRNPKLEIILEMVGEFDQQWKSRLEEKIALKDQPVLKGALTDLVKARNSFAHGGVDELPINRTIECFEAACIVMDLLDQTVHEAIES